MNPEINLSPGAIHELKQCTVTLMGLVVFQPMCSRERVQPIDTSINMLHALVKQKINKLVHTRAQSREPNPKPKPNDEPNI